MIRKDPDCINNLASFLQYREAMENLASKLQNELIKQKDPRALGNSAIFDTYYYMGFEALKELYGERFKVPDHLRKYEFISDGKVE